MMKANAETGKVAGAESPALMTPAIILVRPQLGENIGFAARAMANFGLRDLRLVAPARRLAQRQGPGGRGRGGARD